MLSFGVVSGLGLALDFAVFLMLVGVGIRPAWANFVSASLAVTFVYFTSTKKVFAYRGRFLLALFAVYVGYQVLAVAAASWAVGALVDGVGLYPALAKIAILPVTFTVNYLVLHFLTATRG